MKLLLFQVLIIGGGPCGLRTAIEAQLLGAKVVVVEKRDRFSRNNVLHLWPFVIHDLRGLGAKKFFGKFCAGSIDHISTPLLLLLDSGPIPLNEWQQNEWTQLRCCPMIGVSHSNDCSSCELKTSQFQLHWRIGIFADGLDWFRRLFSFYPAVYLGLDSMIWLEFLFVKVFASCNAFCWKWLCFSASKFTRASPSKILSLRPKTSPSVRSTHYSCYHSVNCVFHARWCWLLFLIVNNHIVANWIPVT